MKNNRRNNSTRRDFLASMAAGTAGVLATPYIVTAKKTDSRRPIIGSGELQYEVHDQWAQLPHEFSWQTTHNVAIDSQNHLYVIHEGNKKDHPAIFVFDDKGQYVRSFGPQFQFGGHGLEVHNEGGEDFLYVTAYQTKRSFAKLTTTGETVWHKYAPMQAGKYAEGEDILPREENTWGRACFHPTNFAFHPDGDFYLSDGYGSYRIHRYDSDGNWKSCFGEPSKKDRKDGTFKLPHGLWVDSRGDQPEIAVADRANHRLQWFTLEGEHLRTQKGFRLPANCDTFQDLLLVPELEQRITILGKDNEVLVRMGDDPEGKKAGKPAPNRTDESTWTAGKFVHPHDACFDKEGNIFVAEWVKTGRITKLKRVG